LETHSMRYGKIAASFLIVAGVVIARMMIHPPG
jgi:hypothetical protein